MGTEKRERHKAGHRARLEAAQEAERKARNRRRVLMLGALVVVVVAVVAVATLVANRSDETSSSTSTTRPPSATSTTAAPVASAAGLPCVPLAGALPAGAPDVPVPVGPPPEQLVVEDIVVGDGAEVPAGDPSVEVTVQYIGVSCSTGEVFDSSWSRGQPATFALGGVIDGWTEGIPGMKVGGQRMLVIPPDKGYGSTGSATIAPDETLVFVVDLVEIPS